ncbi:MAG: hypothetical protein ABIZ04_15580, partial [Opitutus sp.]
MPKKLLRPKTVHFRCTQEEFDLIESERKAAGVPRSEYGRQMMSAGKVVKRDAISDTQWSAMSGPQSNLNQLMKRLNENKAHFDPVVWQQLYDELCTCSMLYMEIRAALLEG